MKKWAKISVIGVLLTMFLMCGAQAADVSAGKPDAVPLQTSELTRMEIRRSGEQESHLTLTNPDDMDEVAAVFNAASYEPYAEPEETPPEDWTYWVLFYKNNQIAFEYIIRDGLCTGTRITDNITRKNAYTLSDTDTEKLTQVCADEFSAHAAEIQNAYPSALPLDMNQVTSLYIRGGDDVFADRTIQNTAQIEKMVQFLNRASYRFITPPNPYGLGGCSYYLEFRQNEKVLFSYNLYHGQVKPAAMYQLYPTEEEELYALVNQEFTWFSDTSQHWAKDAIAYAYKRGLFSGVSDTEFAPNAQMNRTMLVTVLYRMEEEPDTTVNQTFTDVDANAWYAKAVAWASEKRIVSGYNDTTFGPENTVTREQMVLILSRYIQFKNYDANTTEVQDDLSMFADQDQISKWALPAVKWAHANGLMNGRTSTTLAPQGSVTRAEAAQMFMTFEDYIRTVR